MKKIKKKILILTPYFLPEPFPINSFANELINNNVDVTVITGLPNYRQYGFYKNYSLLGPYYENINNINIIRLPIVPRFSNSVIAISLFYISFFLTSFFFILLFGLLKRNKIDHLFTFCGSPVFVGYIGFIGGKILNCKSSQWIQDIWPEAIKSTVGTKFNFFEKIIDFFQIHMWSISDILFSQSDSLSKYLKSKFPNSKIVTLYNPARQEIITLTKSIKENRNNITFTYMGNIGNAQYIDLFLDAFTQIKKKYTLNMCGDGSKLTYFKKKYNQNNIIWHGWIKNKEIINIVKKTDFFILSLNSLGRQSLIIPSKLQTYFMYGRPVLCFSKGATYDLIKNIGTGLVSSSINSKEIMNIFLKAGSLDIDIRDKMANKAFSYYKNNFLKKMVVKTFISSID